MAVDVDIELQVKIDNLRTELEKIPGISKKESKKMAAAWSREYKAIEKSAARTAKESERSAERVREGWKSAGERTASLMGGVFGDISDSVLDLGGRMNELSSEIGGTGGAMVGVAGIAAGMAAAVGFASHAFLEWMDGVEDARKELERFNGIPPMDDEHKKALDRYVEVSRKAEGASAALALQLKAELAPAATEMELAFLGLASSMHEVSDSGAADTLWGVHEALQMTNLPQLAVNAAWDAMVGAGEEVVSELEVLTEAQTEANRALREGSDEIRVTNEELNEYAEALGYVRETYVDLDEQDRKRKEAAKKAAEEERKRWEDAGRIAAARVRSEAAVGAAYATRAEEERKANEAGEKAWEQQRVDLERATQGFDRLGQSATTAGQSMLDAIGEEQQEALLALGEMTWDIVDGAMQARLDAIVEQEQAARRLHAKEKERLQSERDRIEAQIESGKLAANEGKQELARIDAQMEANAKARREERKAAREARMEAHRAAKASAIARATIDAAANAVALTAAFAYLGPGAPAAAVAVSAAQLALQVAAIKKVKPPKFAGGGMARDRMEGDHQLSYLDPNEGVLTPRGVQAAGGPQGVAALNAGGGMGGGTALISLDRRILGEVVVDVIENDSRVAVALDRRSGAIPGHRR